MDLTETKDIKKRWQEYTELYKKDLHDPDNHDGVITHLEPGILESEVKSLGYTKVTDRFKRLDLIECLKNCGQRFITLYRRQ